VAGNVRKGGRLLPEPWFQAENIPVVSCHPSGQGGRFAPESFKPGGGILLPERWQDWPGKCNQPNKQVSTETIYQYAYDSIRHGDTKLRDSLRHGHIKRRKRPTGKEKRGIIPNRTMIDQRLPEVNIKQTYGHWEGDTVEGAGKSGYISTFVERYTKILLAYPIPNKTTKYLNHAAEVLFRRIPAAFKKSLTVDNGTEFTKHQILAHKIQLAVFFAHPYHSWERGLNGTPMGYCGNSFQGTMFYET